MSFLQMRKLGLRVTGEVNPHLSPSEAGAPSTSHVPLISPLSVPHYLSLLPPASLSLIQGESESDVL